MMIIKEKTTLDPSLDFVKVVVDLEKGTLSAVCDLHIDCAEELAGAGSEWKNLWGANVNLKTKNIVCISMVNIRPGKNDGMEIQDPAIKSKVEEIIKNLLL